MPRKRRFSEEPFGPTIERLMDETGVTYRGLAAKTGSPPATSTTSSTATGRCRRTT